MRGDGIVLTTRTQARIGEDGSISGKTTTEASGPQAIALRSMAAWFEGRGTAYAAGSQLQQLGTPGSGRFAFESPNAELGDYRVVGSFALDDPLEEGGAAPFSVPGGLGVFGRPGKLLLGPVRPRRAAMSAIPARRSRRSRSNCRRVPKSPSCRTASTARTAAPVYRSTYALEDGTSRIRREFRVQISHQLCRDAEFAPMRAVLVAARRDQQRLISLDRPVPQRIATGQ